MNALLVWALQILPVVVLLYFYVKHKYSYWAKLGVKGPVPSLLKFGNVWQIFGENPSVVELELMSKYGKVYGNYVGLEPALTVADSELIKQILVKDFPSFLNRRILKTSHEFANFGQFRTDDPHWKRIRTITSPTFTSGKLRGMHKIMGRCADKLGDYFRQLIKNGDGVFNTKEVIAGFTIDVIASTSFATETNANDDRSQQNPFVSNGMRLFEVNPLRALSSFAMPLWFNKLVKIQHGFNVKCYQFFIDLTSEIVKQRRNGTVGKRNDVVQLLMDTYAYDVELNDGNYDKLAADMDKDDVKKVNVSKNSKKTQLSDREIIAQCLTFFIAGFETTAVTISNIMFELARNPQVQERLNTKLHQALDGVDPNSDKHYEIVMSQIPYLDSVIKETLRKYPPVRRLERRCTVEEYKIGGIPVKKDQLIEIPVYGVQHNPEYYPDPEAFNPDRFMPENKHLLVPYTYLPFGDGPRNCIGMRFAYQEIKLCLAAIVQQFRFSPCSRTPQELQFQGFKPVLSVVPFSIKVSSR